MTTPNPNPDRPTANHRPTEAMIPKRTSPGLIVGIVAGLFVVAMIGFAVVDATVDPVDDGLDNIETMINR
ncbi:MAG: hypothetical protein RIF41_12070 [Polyangiaceae bacterium]